MRRAVQVVEAAYRWHPEESEWLAGVVAAADAYELGRGLVGYTVDLRRRPRVSAIATSSVSAEPAAAALTALTKNFSPAIARSMYEPTEFAGNAAFRLSRVARRIKTSRRALERDAGHELPPVWAVVAGDPCARVAVLSFVAPSSITAGDPYPSRRNAKQLGLIGAHLGAALRLRSALSPPRANDSVTEAVLTPRGRVVHATGAAVDQRRSLAEAVVSIERARLRRVAEDEALRLWNALVAGRWSIVEITESDGKRLLLARRNAVNGKSDLLALTELERDVAWLASMGHSYKYIAYELGITISTVIRRLDSAMQKLRMRSRHQLLRAFAAARADNPEEP